MKVAVLSVEGKKAKEIDFPRIFSGKVREDIVLKILEAKKSKQPYSPSPVGGKQHSASGKIVHRRHVWKSGYGRGMSRIPRKVMSKKGSRFNWVGAEVASTRGGRRAHPPKTIAMINTKKINKKEMKQGLTSALSATADKKMIASKYGNLNEKDFSNPPFIVESKFVSLKSKELISSLKKVLGKRVFNNALKKKKVRSGRGKSRGRKYKSNAGILLVIGNKEKIKTGALDVQSAKNLSVSNLAKGGLGRVTIYTENAIRDLEEKLKYNERPSAVVKEKN